MKKMMLIVVLVVLGIAARAQKGCSIEGMFYAIAQVESNTDVNKRNGDCVGILQIRPIMVKEANRILGFDCFYLNDRWDSQGSYAIFSVIMEEKNPNGDLKKACKIWNPTAGEWYYQRVLKAYKAQRLDGKEKSIMNY